MHKRLLLILIAFCQLLGAVSLAASASTVYTINGVDITCDDYSSRPGNCRAYAEAFYKDLWGTGFSSDFYDDDNLLRNLETEELVLTEELLKSCVQQAAIGSVIRVSSLTYLHRNDGPQGHTQLIVQKDENGFTVLEGGMAAPPYYQEYYYTWNEFVTAHWLGGKYGYLKYVKWPGAPEYSHDYDDEAPAVSGLTAIPAADGTGFTATFTAEDESAITAAYLRVWPQGGSEEQALQFPCVLGGNAAMAEVPAAMFGTESKNFLCQWYAMDANGNVGGGEKMPALVSLYMPEVTFRGVCQVSAVQTKVCRAPAETVDGKDTRAYYAVKGDLYIVTGLYRDAEGVAWYALEGGQWIRMRDMKYNTLASFFDWLSSGYESKQVLYRNGQLLFTGE